MRQKVADADLLLAVLREGRQYVSDGLVEGELPLRQEQHKRGRGRHDLGERGQVVHRVRLHLVSLGRDNRSTVYSAVGQLLADTESTPWCLVACATVQHGFDHGARELSPLDRAIDRAGDLRELLSYGGQPQAPSSTTGPSWVSVPRLPSSSAAIPTPSARLSATCPNGRSSTMGPSTSAFRISATTCRAVMSG